MREVRLYAGERIDDLQFHGMRIIQRADAFRFGTDAVLLADFAQPKSRETAADLGTGTGAIALLMAMHHPNITVDAVELQPDIADMAWRSAYLNGMDERVRVHHMDMRDAPRLLGHEKYTLVVCNPPYGRDGSAMVNDNAQLRTARHEGGLTPEMVCETAFKLLKYGGRFAVVFPAQRAYEMMRAMDANRLAPKRIRTVHAVAGRAPKLILIDAIKGGGSQLHWQDPLILANDDGTPTAEWKRIFESY